MRLVDARTMKEMDRRAMETYGVSGLQLMENAGRGVADVAVSMLDGGRGPVAVVAGKGNNGGDGFVAARHLCNRGVSAVVFSLASIDEIKGDAGRNARSWVRMGGEVHLVRTTEELKRHFSPLMMSTLIIDAVLGTGLSSPVEGFYGEVIDLINGLDKPVLSVDVPSGLCASTGRVLGRAVSADVTATMALPKTGLYVYPGRAHAGRIEVVDIGAPRAVLEEGEAEFELVDEDFVWKVLRPRGADSHKGTYGHLLVAAGSPGKGGAAYMSAAAAMRAGAGLVTLAVPESIAQAMEAKTTEVMTCALAAGADGAFCKASADGARALLEGKSALAVGPGIGASDATASFVSALLREARCPVVVDADGLNVLAGRLDGLKEVEARLVLTPHPGEAARLLGTTAAGVQDHRLASARRLADLTGAVVVLKGAGTVVAAASGKVYVNPTGSAALASAGTGDILTGIIGALLAQGAAPAAAAAAGAYIHGLAAQRLASRGYEAGLVATDLLEALPPLLSELSRSRDP
ncbi:MAG TPA: NAD(P)H-hydrate dehydratase [Deltaproteobacteria bacterium]|nr:NAD(P)H-hydrate dehydratase [Deltaproteobacteria bacterium]